MGLFKKKEDKNATEFAKYDSDISLPKLPDFPKLDDSSYDNFNYELPKLPSFPDNQTGRSFSQNTIKQAVTGKEVVKEEDESADYEPEEYSEEYDAQKQFATPKRISLKKEVSEFNEVAPAIKRTEPLFIRIDKFEESIQTLKKTKEQISEMEKMLSDIKQIKEKESKELEYWESEVRSIKERIEKINSNIFSKIE
jgi:hypothetical protein